MPHTFEDWTRTGVWDAAVNDVREPRTRQYVLAGTPLPNGGCNLRSEVSSKRPERIVDRVVQMDTIGCSFLMARGDAPRWPLARRGPGALMTRLGSLSKSGSDARTPPSGGSSTLLAWIDCGRPSVDIARGRQRVYWHDPVVIPVASDEIDLNWSFNNICAFDGPSYHTMNWFSASGWLITNYDSYGLLDDLNGQWVLGKGDSYYLNLGYPYGFPACTSPITANVRTNQVYGYYDGSVSWTYSADLVGPACQYLLSLVIEREHTVN